LIETRSRSLSSGLLQPSAYGIKLSGEVEEALHSGKPVVALESTIISHGMPFPQVSAFCCRHPTNQSDDPHKSFARTSHPAPPPLPSPFSKFHPCLPAAHRFLGDFLQEMAHKHHTLLPCHLRNPTGIGVYPPSEEEKRNAAF